MSKSIIGVLVGFLILFLWIVFVPMAMSENEPIVLLRGWMVSLNFLGLQLSLVVCLSKKYGVLNYVIAMLYFVYFGFLGVMLSFLSGNWVIAPFMLIPFLNAFTYMVAAIWIGIIGLGKSAMNAMINSPVLSAPLFIVPLTAITVSKIVNKMFRHFLKIKLEIIEDRIKNLQKIIEKHEEILAQRNEIERKINRIVAIDPHNLKLKVTLFSERAHGLIDNKIEERIKEIDMEIHTMTSLRRRTDDKLRALENEKDALEYRLKDINKRLHMLEIIDPANIEIKMQMLKAVWEGAKQQELEKIKPKGEIETLFKEQLLLGFRIKEKNIEIENVRKEVAHLKLTEDILQLEKLVLELEEIDRKIKGEEPRFFKLRDKLNDLEIKQDQIKQSLEQQD